MSSSDILKIPLHEISSATKGFDEANIIGRGGYGVVYRGQSEQYGMLAIKRLDRVLGQGDHEYGTEVQVLSKYEHENLVSLVGFCAEDNERILAYKYEANGSLEKVLHRKDLSWRHRLEICIGAARGLRFLHGENGHGVIHRDVKSSNILLDENWKAKISDCGLSKIALTNSANSFIYTNACGTIGYVDPEYSHYGTLTQKSDVYSFGVVLFEVLFGKLVTTRRRPNDRTFNLSTAQNHYENNTLVLMIDSDLRKQMNSTSLSTFSTIAYQCLNDAREDRPTMSLVVEALEKALRYQPAPSGFLHDVYISFRHQTTAEYVDRLCDALEEEGLSTYKDNIRTSRKESVLRSAIKKSGSFIIIFSKNFSANSWNLEEVADIMKCVRERRSLVIPIFFDVYPSEVREQTAFFGSAMSKYDSCPGIGEWRKALAEAANVPGLEESNYRSAQELAKEVAARIKAQLFGER